MVIPTDVPPHLAYKNSSSYSISFNTQTWAYKAFVNMMTHFEFACLANVEHCRMKIATWSFCRYIDDMCCCTASSQSTYGLLGDSSPVLVRKVL